MSWGINLPERHILRLQRGEPKLRGYGGLAGTNAFR
jgi:hypothetical protein